MPKANNTNFLIIVKKLSVSIFQFQRVWAGHNNSKDIEEVTQGAVSEGGTINL